MLIKLVKGSYYYNKKTKETLRYDGWAMQLRENGYICWEDIPPLEQLEEVTWGVDEIPLQDFTMCECY